MKLYKKIKFNNIFLTSENYRKILEYERYLNELEIDYSLSKTII